MSATDAFNDQHAGHLPQEFGGRSSEVGLVEGTRLGQGDQSETDCRQPIHVVPEGPVYELDVSAGFDLLLEDPFAQVRADAPVGLRWIDHVIVHPPTTWGLQQWMVENEHQASPGLQHPRHLLERPAQVVKVFEDQTDHEPIECTIREGQRDSVAGQEARAHVLSDRTPDLFPRRIDPDETGHELGQGPRHLALPTPEVEYPSASLHRVANCGNDLSLVLGVGTVGERRLPP